MWTDDEDSEWLGCQPVSHIVSLLIKQRSTPSSGQTERHGYLKKLRHFYRLSSSCICFVVVGWAGDCWCVRLYGKVSVEKTRVQLLLLSKRRHHQIRKTIEVSWERFLTHIIFYGMRILRQIFVISKTRPFIYTETVVNWRILSSCTSLHPPSIAILKVSL